MPHIHDKFYYHQLTAIENATSTIFFKAYIFVLICELTSIFYVLTILQIGSTGKILTCINKISHQVSTLKTLLPITFIIVGK